MISWRSAVLLVAGACGAAQVERVPDLIRAEWKHPRLPQTVRPLAYRLDLQVIPGEDLQGTVEIDVEVLEPTRIVYLNGRHLRRVDAHAVIAGRTVPLTVAKASDAVLGLVSDERLRGNATLVLHFTAPVGKEAKGAFVRTIKTGDSYVYTQFEPTWARRAFPCFDEPGWKTPWQLTLRVRPEHRAYANTPIASERREGGLKVIRFKATPPLPSYLVAFAVGKFVAADGGRSKGGVPVRFIMPLVPGNARSDAVEARELLDKIESYLGVPFPFEKLDLIFVPGFNGGMENAGLITLGDPSSYVIAHEIAHHWFGDFVTAAWWNDIWLHESFATWLGQKVSPDDWRAASVFFDDPGVVLEPKVEDDEVEARATYEKGGAILGMIESWVGEARFREAVRELLRRHAWSSIATDDFYAVLPEARSVLQSVLSRAGVPVVEMELECAGRPHLQVRQRARPFTIPICVRTDSGDTCRVIAESSGTVPLGDSCPSWLAPNRDARGIYTLLPGEKSRFVFEQSGRLREPERERLLVDLMSAFQAKQLSAAEALPLLEAVARNVGKESRSMLDWWRQTLDPMVPDDVRKNFEIFARRVLPRPSLPEVEAKQHFEAWLGGAPVQLVDPAIPVAVGNGDQALFARLRTELARRLPAALPAEVVPVVIALGSFRDARLGAAALAMAEQGEIPRKYLSAFLAAMAQVPETRALARRFLLDRSPDSLWWRTIVELLRTTCDEPTLVRAREWVPAELKGVTAYALSEAQRCVELRAYHEPGLRAFLATINP